MKTGNKVNRKRAKVSICNVLEQKNKGSKNAENTISAAEALLLCSRGSMPFTCCWQWFYRGGNFACGRNNCNSGSNGGANDDFGR